MNTQNNPFKPKLLDTFPNPIQKDWELLQEEFTPPLLGGKWAPFDPRLALSFARKLAEVSCYDDVVHLENGDLWASQAYKMSAFFAYPYLQRDFDTPQPRMYVQGAALAQAVAHFLEDLESKLAQPPTD